MPNNDGNIVKRTSQYIDNMSFDETTELPMAQIAGTDGSDVYRVKVNSSGELAVSGTSAAAPIYATLVDDYSEDNITYVGRADTGSASSSAVWQIRKIDESIGATTTWADGDGSFNNIWDNRESLTYS